MIHLRLRTDTDDDFLFRLYTSTREEEMALTGWNASEQEHFLRMQYLLQCSHYESYYPNSVYQIIQQDKLSIGRLIVEEKEDEIIGVDIALLPEFRNRGIGKMLIEKLLTSAHRKRKPFRIHVQIGNRAIRLYERLGFRQTGEVGYHIAMEHHNEKTAAIPVRKQVAASIAELDS